MKYFFISVLLLLLQVAYCQEETARKFTIEIVNNSRLKVYCSLSDVFSDSLKPGKSIRIVRPVTGKQSIPGYLRINSYGTNPNDIILNSIQRIICDDVKDRKIVINSDRTILFSSNYSETWMQSMLKNGWPVKSTEEIGKIIRDNPDDPASADLISIKYLNSSILIDTISRFYNLLSPRIKNSLWGNKISDYLKNRMGFIEGAEMKDFSLPDTSNMVKTLSSVKSEYILIDFWFSHCTPCLESFPALIKL